MSILSRYLARVFIGHLTLVLISAVALLQLFDIMSNADDLLEDLGGGADVMLRYTLLRLPILITFLLPFSVLIAGLMTFGRLHRYSELVAIQALGMPFHNIVLLLLPIMLAVAFLHFLISDQLTPRAHQALADWQAASTTPTPDDIALWLRDGDHLVSIGSIDEDGRRLNNIVVFKRNAEGSLTAQVKAQSAVFEKNAWWLLAVDELTVRPHADHPSAVARMPWQTAIEPVLVKDLAAPPDALSFSELKRILRHPDIGSRPAHVYQTWQHKSFALPLASLFMVVLATASVRGLQRQGGVVLNALVGFGAAFFYFVADGVLQALGEAGSIAPAVAAWLPIAILAVTSGLVLSWVAMPRGRRKSGIMPATAEASAKVAST